MVKLRASWPQRAMRLPFPASGKVIISDGLRALTFQHWLTAHQSLIDDGCKRTALTAYELWAGPSWVLQQTRRKFDCLRARSMKIPVCWHVTLSRSVKTYHGFGGAGWLILQDRGLKMDLADSSKMLISVWQIVPRHIPEDRILDGTRRNFAFRQRRRTTWSNDLLSACWHELCTTQICRRSEDACNHR
jgi:hypothetical protein